MDYQSLSNVLGILRLIRASQNVASSELIRRWAGQEVDDSGILRIAAYIVEQVAMAQAIITNSHYLKRPKKALGALFLDYEQRFR